MTSIEALEAFLTRAAIRKRDRYLEFVRSPKRRPDFLVAICHRLEGDLDPRLVVQEFSDSVLARPAYLYGPDPFGQELSSLRALTESYTNNCLAVASDASAAVLRGEHRLDDQVFYLLDGAPDAV